MGSSRPASTQSHASTVALNHASTNEAGPPPPFSANFTDKTIQMTMARKKYLAIVGFNTFGLAVIIFGLFSIYWGALWKLPAHNLRGWIVDFDGGEVGQSVIQGLQAAQPFGKISWTVVPSSKFPGGPNQLADDVLNEKVWVSAVINPNASNDLNAAIASVDASYNSSNAVTVYAIEGRSENAFRTLIRPAVQAAFGTIMSQFANHIAQQLSSSPNITKILNTAPQLVTQPISYTLDNVRPFDIPVATAMTFVGLIYLFILSFFVVTGTIPARAGLERNLTTGSLIRLRIATSAVVYFFLSLFYSLLSLAFQVDFSRHYGKAGFVIFWILNFLAMLSYGLALEAMVTILTMRFIFYFLATFVVVNVSVCFYPLDALPRIFHYGYAAPFFAVSRGARSVLFGTKNELGLSFGILIAWVTISSITLPFFQWYMRRKDVCEARKVQEGEKTSA